MLITDALTHISEQSFREMLNIIPSHGDISISPEKELQLDSKEYNSVMITVSSSVFRLLVFLHIPAFDNTKNTLKERLNLDQSDAKQQYYDYICELCNNLCGVTARILRNANYPTGLSTPTIMVRAFGSDSLSRAKPSKLAHYAAKFPKGLGLATSYCLHINHNHADNIDINIKANEQQDDASGELEFF